MEQKQLEDLDESYFGEEFVDEEPLQKTAPGFNRNDDIKIEAVEVKQKPRRKSPLTKNSPPTAENLVAGLESTGAGKIGQLPSEFPAASGSSMETTVKKGREKLPQLSLKADAAAKAKAEAPTINFTVSGKNINNSGNAVADNDNSGINSPNGKNASNESSAKTEFNAETKRLIDPFKPDKNSPKADRSSAFADVSTWKAITGITVILLIFSVFTQGFHITGDASTSAAVIGKEISREEAEWRVVQYVNEQLLEPPFLATSEGASEAGPLYKILLNIAGEKVVSYVTKDGRLFFPQGMDISFFLTVEEVEKKPSQLEDIAAGVEPGRTIEKAEEENIRKEATEVASDSKTNNIKLTAKKWLFSPYQIVVKQGQTVTLIIEPENLEFTFAIPELDIKKEITEPTVVEFTPDKKGSFSFTCSSCEEWRGMAGVLVVE